MKRQSSDPSQANSALSRRQFGKASAVAIGASAGFHFFPALANKRLEKPTLAAIGIGGKGNADNKNAAKVGFEIVALVDIVDIKKLKNVARRLKSVAGSRDDHPDAEFFSDYREMLSQMGDKVDAVMVSTPDHHHFHASALAMQAGKHVYCQKPLTHGIWEARQLTQIAKQTGLKTQMGNQAHANDVMRRGVELIRSGIIGKVQEIHAWTNRPIWPQGFAARPEKQPVPDGIDWQQWIGPAPWTDYSPHIAPFAWRGWWDYGCGALGDMACHIMDLGYWAMNPGPPQSVRATQSGATELSAPINSIVTWDFGPNQYSAADGFKFHWYDGYVNATFDRKKWQLEKHGDQYNHPAADVLDGQDFEKFGSVIIGSEGKMFFRRSAGWVITPDALAADAKSVPKTLPRAPQQNNYGEWISAIQGTIDQSESNFSLAGPMTETILLGVLAQRFPESSLVWNAEAMEIQGRPELTKHIHREYRDGWKIDV
ncbi:Gfo/Idh/MocA family oxidoreductase [Stieleria sp. TO1_6]|uniref:Gfo/Idh/MocA family protein n=1 Tax=Stieleria tagensis TaxID=2956795 RepID=UPI00209B224E|nr:Gfo/Idh/MocA family oxidoreductase [Stieleria tagensis]MCO8124571.1 Gfo/Idh/MocA family oxidoreductase [Stieleria tagensis]